jgi:hypothetical protein
MRMIFQPSVFRGYFLTEVTHTTADDERYYLCFDTSGSMTVRIHYITNKMYSEPYWSDPIAPTSFSECDVDGKTLTELVSAKLRSILPPGAETA